MTVQFFSVKFRWNRKREAAAELLAENILTVNEIAEKLGITSRAIYGWKKFPEFQLRIQQQVEEFRKKAKAEGLAVWENRLKAYNDRWKRMQAVMNERAADPQMADVAGGKSGLLIHRLKVIGKGDEAVTVDEYEVDAGLLRELRAHEEQAAKELGQWVEKTEAHNYSEADIENLNMLSDDELKLYIQLKQKLAQSGGGAGTGEAPAAEQNP